MTISAPSMKKVANSQPSARRTSASFVNSSGNMASCDVVKWYPLFPQYLFVNGKVVVRQGLRAKVCLHVGPTPHRVDRGNRVQGSRHAGDVVDEGTCDSVDHQLGCGPTLECDHRRTAGHSLDHDETKRLLPKKGHQLHSRVPI